MPDLMGQNALVVGGYVDPQEGGDQGRNVRLLQVHLAPPRRQKLVEGRPWNKDLDFVA